VCKEITVVFFLEVDWVGPANPVCGLVEETCGAHVQRTSVAPGR